jgi:GxxExxY protein
MDTNEERLLYKNEVFQIVGCAIEVLNTLGHGLVEKPYENALAVEFGVGKISFRQQPVFDVLYKEQKVGLFIPDLIVFNAIVVDAKVIDKITDHERGLMLNYLADHKTAGWLDPKFQASQARVGTDRFMN